MTQTNFDPDRNLVAFLRQHCPIAPPPALDLEERIANQVMSSQAKYKSQFGMRRYARLIWLIPAAIAAGFLITWEGNRQLQPTISETEHQTIEASLLGSWSLSIGEDADDSANSYSLFEESHANNRQGG